MLRETLMTIGTGIGLTMMATHNLMEKILVANLSSGGWLLDLLFFPWMCQSQMPSVRLRLLRFAAMGPWRTPWR